MSSAKRGVSNSTYGPTKTNKASLDLATKLYNELKQELDAIGTEINAIEAELSKNKAPFIER